VVCSLWGKLRRRRSEDVLIFDVEGVVVRPALEYMRTARGGQSEKPKPMGADGLCFPLQGI